MISKKTALILLAIIGCAGAITLFTLIKSADFADNAFQKSLRDNGFKITNIEKIEKRIGAVRYHNITFGSEEKTSFNLLDINYKPLLYKNITKIKIDGLFLSGALNINANLNIEGIENINKILTNTNTFPDEISFQNINLSLLSAHFGGIRAVANISGQREGNAIIWTGNIDSRQNQLELIGKLNAQSNDTGTWVTDLDIENAKLERNFGKFTRVNGNVQISGKNNIWEKLNAQLNAGAFITHGMSWQNATLSIDASKQQNKVFIDAKSSGTEGLELNAEGTLNLDQIIWNANIHAETGKQLLNYFDAHNVRPFSEKDIKTIKTLKNINTANLPHQNSLIFRIKKANEEIDIKGKI